MANKVCPECDGFQLVAADNDEGLDDCPTCDGDGFVNDDEEDAKG
ncbi:hypothetical protein ACFT5D_07815 [Streptomyces sp. NPDC057144]